MKKILVVDNHPVMLKFMSDLLKKQGHDVLTAQDGLSALEILKSFIPDVVFIDLVMPNIDGKKLCWKIRGMKQMQDACLIVISGIAAEETTDIRSLGADGCIAKSPINRMGEHILAILDALKKGSVNNLSKKILGMEDVFERRITEELLHAKKHSEVIFDTMEEGIIELTCDGRIIYVNAAGISIVGMAEENLLGTRFVDLFDDIQGAVIKSLMDSIDESPISTPEETPLVINDKLVSVDILHINEERRHSIVVILHDIDHRKKAEAALKEREEQYRTLFETSKDAIMTLSPPEWQFKSANLSTIRMFRAKAAQDLISKTPYDLSPEFQPDGQRSADKAGEMIKNAMTAGSNYFEWTHKRLNNEEFPSTVLLSRVDLEGKQLLQATVRDITERKRAEQTLEKRLKNEKMLREISEKAALIEDAERFQSESLQVIGEALDVSRAYIFENDFRNNTTTNTFEWSAPDIRPQKDVLQNIPLDDIRWWFDILNNNEIIRYKDIENIPSDSVKEILRPQAIKSILVVPLFEKSGFIGFIGFDEVCYYRDWLDEDVDTLRTISEIITGVIERKRTEKALSFERAQLLSIFDSIDEAVYVSDPDTYEILYVNQTMQDELHKKLIGGICYREFQGLDSPCEFCTNEIIRKQKLEPYHWEFYNQAMDKHFAIIDRIIQWPDGRDVRFELAIDITESKKAAEEKKRLEGQLRQAHKMEAIGTLAGGIAHEFNNLLGIILANTETAMDSVPVYDMAHYNLEEILAASLRARDVVNQILAFSRRTKHELKPVRISALIDDSIRFIRSSIPVTIKIKKDISAELETINADPTQINQTLINLCTNATHAMQDGGGTLKIGLENITLDDDDVKSYEGLRSGIYVRMTVSDTGHGIEKENIEHIFDPFFTTKKVGKGTGMGLSVVHGIIKAHHGSITVKSEAGKGTTFSILFPVIDGQVKTTRDSKPSHPQGSEKILFVDDEESLVYAVKLSVRRFGYDVVTQRNPVNALALFEEKPEEFDLVITDMTMPDMTGDKFAKAVMKIRPDIPVILCTGYSEHISEEKAREMGISAFVMKPFSGRELGETIRRVLDHSKI